MNKTTEIWKPVVGYEGLYEVSDWGNVRKLPVLRNENAQPKRWSPYPSDKPRLLALTLDSHGYHQVALRKDGKGRRHLLHRLVLIAFSGPPPFVGAQVNHRNGNKLDNRFLNLEWMTVQQNVRHALSLLDGARHARKTSVEEQEEIAALAASCTRKELAEAYGLHRRSVSRVIASQRAVAGVK
jgi:hypothetical protein